MFLEGTPATSWANEKAFEAHVTLGQEIPHHKASLLVKTMEMVLEDVILPFHEYDNDV